jgi:hypothetical protein
MLFVTLHSSEGAVGAAGLVSIVAAREDNKADRDLTHCSVCCRTVRTNSEFPNDQVQRYTLTAALFRDTM